MLLTVTAAAKAAGVSRTTIYEKINAGEMTRAPGGKIDTAELLRVFGELAPAKGRDKADADSVPADLAEGVAEHVAWMQELVDRQQATIDRQARELHEAAQRAERQEQVWARQLDRVTALLPAPAPEPVAEAAPESERGFWSRMFGA